MHGWQSSSTHNPKTSWSYAFRSGCGGHLTHHRALLEHLKRAIEICFASRWRGNFISHLPRWLCTRCFSEPTFRTSRAPKHRKNRVFRCFAGFLLFAHLEFSSCAFLFSDSSHLCFSICPYCLKVTSKLPSLGKGIVPPRRVRTWGCKPVTWSAILGPQQVHLLKQIYVNNIKTDLRMVVAGSKN